MPKHTLNEEKFIAEMEKRGWRLDDAYGWIKMSSTKRQMEQEWRDSIIAAIECSAAPGTVLVGTPEAFKVLKDEIDGGYYIQKGEPK